MFLINKYSPKLNNNNDYNVSKEFDVLFHKEELAKLTDMAKDDAIPHLIFYGPDGCGKKTIINMFLEMLYDKYIYDLVESEYEVNRSGNNTSKITIKQSNYHIIIEPNNNNFDRYLIQDIVKEYAKRKPFGIFATKKKFKTVLINNVDNLSYYAQTSLRRTMELYSNTCRFIMWSRSLSRVIDPLRSRCYCFSIKSPSDSNLFELLLNICGKEQLTLNLDTYIRIIKLAQGNIKTSLWLLELYKMKEDFNTSYDVIIDKIIKLLLTCEITNISLIRENFYNIIITNIPETQIIKTILNRLLILPQLTDRCKINISFIASKYEHNLIMGRHEIIHLETMIIWMMYSIKYDNI